MWERGLNYGRFRSPAALDDRLKSCGVTHIMMRTGPSLDRDTFAGDVAYWDYVTYWANKWTVFGNWAVYTVPEKRPPEMPYGDILWLGWPRGGDLEPVPLVSYTPPLAASPSGHSRRRSHTTCPTRRPCANRNRRSDILRTCC
jgi:hypothetical protein